MKTSPDATGFSGEDWGQPLKVELPLDPLEAFRLACFGIEYVPKYAPVRVDRYWVSSSKFGIAVPLEIRNGEWDCGE